MTNQAAWKRLGYFYAVFIPFAIIGMFGLIFTTKPELFLWMNQFRHPLLDYFFRTITWLGSGIFFVIICLYYLFVDFRKALLATLSFAISGILAQMLKKLVFSDVVRPVKYFQDQAVINTIEGYHNSLHHSFPSGHTASAFALAVFLALVLPGKKWGTLLCMGAILVGISRIYLAQHFFEDVYAGAWLGVVSTILVFLCFEKWFTQSERLNRNLLNKR